jgi:hypothetical protein
MGRLRAAILTRARRRSKWRCGEHAQVAMPITDVSFLASAASRRVDDFWTTGRVTPK